MGHRHRNYLRQLYKEATPSGSLTRRWLKLSIVARDGRFCNTKWGYGCGRKLKFDEMRLDHIIPMNEGGDPLDLENMQILCEDCHDKKDNHKNTTGYRTKGLCDPRLFTGRFPLAFCMQKIFGADYAMHMAGTLLYMNLQQNRKL